MVFTDYIGITISYANIFIALFIAIYAWMFLNKTNEHKDRRPWDFLFVASIFYLISQLFSVFFVSGVTSLLGNAVDMNLIRNIFSFLYSGCVLLAFVSQHDLILRSELILISKKESPPKKEVDKTAQITISMGDNNNTASNTTPTLTSDTNDNPKKLKKK